MSNLSLTELWFRRAVPNPTQKNLDVQVGVHVEEFGEMLDSISSPTLKGRLLISITNRLIKFLAGQLKKDVISIEITNRKEFLDACVDQVVTATGSGYMAGMQVAKALEEVNSSNFSKFDSDGNPIFDENGKIKKGPNFKKPNLEGLY